MNEPVELDYDALYKEWRVTQEMLAVVLSVTGPVVIPKEHLQRGLPDGAGIQIMDDLQREALIISLEVPNE